MFTASRRYLVIVPLLALLLASLNCTIDMGGSGSSDIGQTQTAMAILQTNLAIQASGANLTATAQQNSLNLTATAQSIPPPPTLPPPPPVVQPTPALNPVGLITPQAPTSAPPPAAFDPAQMKSASILVYEDIVTDPSEYQYVKRTLEAMGLQYQWDGNAIGRLKSHMLSNAPNGRPWDLVILAIETRSSVSGEYFDYLGDILNQGTSVILEAWHLDDVSEGAISPILTKCGVTVYPYFPESNSVNDVVIWPLPDSGQNPLMREPNSGMTFTKARDKWLDSFDLGSKMALTGNGDAQLLLGTDASEPYQDGVLATCMSGQLIIQTFSSHSFTYNNMYPLWENYIYNALRTRLSGQL